MDAAEADADIKLYKASEELLSELQAKVPLLLKNPRTQNPRRRVLRGKTADLLQILNSFQEWPQLLDPILAKLVHVLADAFLNYCILSPHDYFTAQLALYENYDAIEPVPRSICRLLNCLCKIRGYKVIVRLLHNEPKYIEPVLSCFRQWSHSPTRARDSMVWEESHIMLLWLSHLMFAPFELTSISTLSLDHDRSSRSLTIDGLPPLAENILLLAIEHLQRPSKDREAAGLLCVRLALRSDMQQCQVPARLLDWCENQLMTGADAATPSQYQSIGVLTLLFRLVNAASDTEVAPVVFRVFRIAHTIATSDEPHLLLRRDAAQARKMLIKIMRAAMVHAASLDEKSLISETDDLSSMLEEGVQVLLEWLADNDTPVRQAASKALSIVALSLESDMSEEIVEAVLGCLQENVLLEDRRTGDFVAIPDLEKERAGGYKKNVSAVDALKWHGATLTLGHLLYRRSPPLPQLEAIIEALVIGLHFEQRSSAGTSVGVGVRDAACFGLWSLARKYTTEEIRQVPSIPKAATATREVDALTTSNTLQTLANELVLAACLDPSGNMRRGSSAALQELIGRHPNVIAAGIAVVQTVDYHAIARRSRAMMEVAVATAALDPCYRDALWYALMGWRGARATDADSRRYAATAAALLSQEAGSQHRMEYLQYLASQVRALKPKNSGINAAVRHGLLLAWAAMVPVTQSRRDSTRTSLDPQMAAVARPESLFDFVGILEGRVTADLENVMEGVCKLIASVFEHTIVPGDAVSLREAFDLMTPTLERCTLASDKAFVCDAAAEAHLAMFRLHDSHERLAMVDSWLDSKHNKRSDLICKGRVAALSKFYMVVREDPPTNIAASQILIFLCDIIESRHPIETKVYAMEGIDHMIRSSHGQISDNDLARLVGAVKTGLSDYSVDQRGDIGSTLRLVSVEAAKPILLRVPDDRQLTVLITKLAIEKLTKVRFQAWGCLRDEWERLRRSSPTIAPCQDFEHQADVSSVEYFGQLMQLFAVPWLAQPLTMGLVSSTAAGTEEIGRASSEAFCTLLSELSPDKVQQLVTVIFKTVTDHLRDVDISVDRDVVPVIDFLTFVVEQLSSIVDSEDTALPTTEVFDLADRLQIQGSSMARIEALVRLHSGLASNKDLRPGAMEKMTKSLLHRWPKIRGTAADALYLYEPEDFTASTDWTASAVSNKSVVLELRKRLGVSGIPAKPTLQENLPRVSVKN